MKQFIFYFFVFIFLISFIDEVLAVGFSPGSLVYKLPVGKEECQTISLTSDSETVRVSDKWAEDKNMEWKVSSFDTDANYHGLSISYPQKLTLNQRQAQVCLSGKEAGEFHGVVLLTEEQKGSSIIQMGIWIKVLIGNDDEIAKAELNKTIIPKKNITITNTNNQIINEADKLSEGTNEQESNTNTQSGGTVVIDSQKSDNPINWITWAVIGANGQINYKIISILLLSIIIVYIIIIIFKKMRKPRWERGYY